MMGTTASPFLNPIAAEPESAALQLSARTLSRRARQRRQIQAMIAASYLIDALVLFAYTRAGSIPPTIAPAYAATGLLSGVLYLVLSETGFAERFKDHYLVLPQLCTSAAIMLAFAYLAPEVGVMFLCLLFLVFNFGSLRSTPRQSAIVWTAVTLGIATLLLLSDKPIGLPYGNELERFATTLMFALIIGCCIFLGMFSASMR